MKRLVFHTCWHCRRPRQQRYVWLTKAGWLCRHRVSCRRAAGAS